jgi:hypothetical protein
MRVAVVGAGLFGITVALRLDAMGVDVDLFDRHEKVLSAASTLNQFRVHRGYHYPRSSETGMYLLETADRFRAEYGETLVEGERHLYGIASEDSLTNAEEFVEFMDTHGLQYREVEDSRVDSSQLDLLVEVREQLLDPHRLVSLCTDRLTRSNVRLRLGEVANETSTAAYDRVVVCGYATSNVFFDRNPGLGVAYQFEVCEKPVVRMPGDFGRPSIVILDGPFMCIDPVGSTNLFAMGNVVHAIHATNVGMHPDVPEHLAPVLDSGVVQPPAFTRFGSFVESGCRFVPAMEHAEHVGSMFTTRTVFPRLEQTDARPTIVRVLGERTISVFAGKLATCVDAADTVVRLLE